MYQTTDGSIVTSPSDLTAASACELAVVRTLDAKLGRIEAPPKDDDPMLRRAGRLGDEHEARILERYRRDHAVVVEIDRPDVRDPDALTAATAATQRAFADEADVVFQATFYDGETLGFADFIVRQADGSYQVQDSKLARSAKVTALLQLAAYADHLERLGVRVHPTAVLLLGDGSVSEHALTDVAPVYRERAAHLRRLIDSKLADDAAAEWGDERYVACGRCAVCEPLAEAASDLILVAGMRSTTRAKLRAHGITTLADLVANGDSVPDVAAQSLAKLRHQAELQLSAVAGAPPPFDIIDAKPIGALPVPDAGDIFFDFEGDPLYSEPGESDETQWGLDYLFGLVESDGTFVSFWAHSLAEERVALRQFLDYLAERRARFPGMHVYHYAAYERTHLLSLAARHGVGEVEIDDLLRDGVLVDLYPAVRHSLRLGDRSYSLKQVEKLYLDAARSGEVTTGGDSVEEYARARLLREDGRREEAQAILDEIAAYNEIDCQSTLQLRDWLLAQGAKHGVRPGAERSEEEGTREPFEESPVAIELRALAGDPTDPQRSADQRAIGLASAAVDFHRREVKSYWQGHFDRLKQPIDDWAQTRDVLVVNSADVVADWHRETARQSLRRLTRVSGELAPGSKFTAGTKVVAVYSTDGPPFRPDTQAGSRQAHSGAVVLENYDDGSFLLRELLTKGVDEHSALPEALTPGIPPGAAPLQSAIAEWSQQLLDARPGFPCGAITDILRRTLPRTRSGAGLVAGDDKVAALLASLQDLDSSYIAVQGPPGTGKTYTGAHVVAALAAAGWKIGVVAQSHATVENLLDGILAAGLDPDAVGKRPRDSGADEPPWRKLNENNSADFLAEPGGRVLGGTAWTFSNAKHVPRGALDLLVIDEAGQFSLANTIACGVAAKSLLLLGDPQQLPQVSQGVHPEPVDGSALGWISKGYDVLPPDLGYFLPATRRMTTPLTDVVSHLSYDGALTAHDSADARHLDGVEPGVHAVCVEHVANATESAEEAARVVELARDLLGTTWTSPGSADRQLVERDIIVVAPYNAQVNLVTDALRAASLGDVRVGTVDKFQGQEAVVAIVTLAASSPAEVPRGMEFLIMRNRINVAISRAQWAAYVVHSPALVDYVPSTPRGLAELSAFLRVVRPG